MKDKWNEEKLTAFVLGELSEAEAREIQDRIDHSEDLRKEVEEIRETVRVLEDAFLSEDGPSLTDQQRGQILGPAGRKAHVPSRWYRYIGATAAALMLAFIFANLPVDLELDPTIDVPDAPVPGPQSVPRIEPQVPATSDDQLGEPEGTPEPKAQTLTPATQRAEVDSLTGPDEGSLQDARSPIRTAEVTNGSQSLEEEATRLSRDLSQVSKDKKESPVSIAVTPTEVPMAEFAAAPAGVVAGASNEGRTRRMVFPGKIAASIAMDEPGSRMDIQPPTDVEFNTEAYDWIDENQFVRVTEHPLSTFSIDVDTASYSNVRRFLNSRQMPPRDSVRIEELINYFNYEYATPSGDEPFAVHIETSTAPWNSNHQLVRFGLKGRGIDFSNRKPGNLVFLLDVSGSMQPANKLPLLKKAFRLLVDKLGEKDRVALVVYAGASGVVLPSTECTEKEKIVQALERLEAGGSTNGASGIQLAYQIASSNFIEDGVNRVILATDGDFNVGVTNQGDLTRLIEEKAKSGVFLTVLGFGMGNYKDSTLEKLADKGNGNYAYIDTIQEARKVLVEEIGGTLVTIAKDVKIQVEFNPNKMEAYRLIGYENRLLRDEDFNDDTKDAGEIGAGHTVTVLYEIVPKGVQVELPPAVDPLKYQVERDSTAKATSGELLTLKLRYKEPQGDTSKLIEIPVETGKTEFSLASTDFRFAAAVAGFGMVLRESRFAGELTLDRVVRIAEASQGEDSQGYRTEFINLVKKARALKDLETLDNR